MLLELYLNIMIVCRNLIVVFALCFLNCDEKFENRSFIIQIFESSFFSFHLNRQIADCQFTINDSCKNKIKCRNKKSTTKNSKFTRNTAKNFKFTKKNFSKFIKYSRYQFRINFAISKLFFNTLFFDKFLKIDNLFFFDQFLKIDNFISIFSSISKIFVVAIINWNVYWYKSSIFECIHFFLLVWIDVCSRKKFLFDFDFLFLIICDSFSNLRIDICYKFSILNKIFMFFFSIHNLILLIE